MRTLLIRPFEYLLPLEAPGSMNEPLGLLYVASMIRSDHEVSVLDCMIEKNDYSRFFVNKFGVKYVHVGCSLEMVRKRIAQYKPDVVGVTTPYFSQLLPARKICKAAKEVDEEITVVAGGPVASTDPVGLLNLEGCIDILVVGEGEIAFKELLDCHCEGLDKIQGLAYRKNGKPTLTFPRPLIKDLDSIPFPSRDLVPFKNYSKLRRHHPDHKTLSKIVNLPYLSRIYDMLWTKRLERRNITYMNPVGSIITSRGCPFDCNFCAIHPVWGYKYRMRSPENVLEEVAMLKRKYHVNSVLINDDNFNLNKKRAIEILKGLIKLDITWFPMSGLYIDTLDREFLTWTRKSGCNHITIAVESGNQQTLTNIIKKPLKLRKANTVIEECKNLGISTEGFFVIGMPGETIDAMKDTIKFAALCGLDDYRIYVCAPIPGSRVYKECVENGYLTEDFDYSRLQVARTQTEVKVAVIKTEEFSPEDVLRLRRIGLSLLEKPLAMRRRLLKQLFKKDYCPRA